ncbi:NAD-dependent protein deacylase [compost metagenome]
MKEKIVVLSGAGISAESGISTFRDSNGLWENYRIEEVATPEAWRTNSGLVQRFYNQRRKQVLESFPNAAHHFFKELESHYNVILVTQNIDDLHERAGSTNVIHLHGNIRYSKSSGPKQEAKYYPVDGWELRMDDYCDDGYLLRPHVVWFGENVPEMDKAIDTLTDADYLIVIGTSLNVYPAAGLIHYVSNSCKKFLVDPKASELNVDSNFLIFAKSAVESISELKKVFFPA